MRNSIIRLLLFIVSMSVAGISMAEKQNDFGANISVGFTKKFNKRISLGLSEEVRLLNNCTEFSRLESSLSFTGVIVKKHLKASAVYANHFYEKNNCFLFNHRVAGQLTGSVGTKRLDISLRARYQCTFKDERFGNTRKHNPDQVLRGRLSVSYDITKIRLTPFALAEVYYSFWDKDITCKKYEAGLEFKINKKNSITASFSASDNKKNWEFFANLGYAFKF